jgi:CHAD domain-containing protein
MSYRLDPMQSAHEDLRRAAVEQLESAVDALANANAADRPKAVHTARKAVKKTRALLRLGRSGMPSQAYGRTMRSLRDAGRLLSGARDADVLAHTIDGLATHYVGQLPASAYRDLRRDVAALAAAPETDDQVQAAIARLKELVGDAAGWSVDDTRWATIREEAARTYARGRKQFASAAETADAKPLHEWRKRVKDLWYHQRLLRNAWKPVMRAHSGETDRLGELLGDEHDLAVLSAFLDDHRAELSGHLHLEDVIELTSRRRTELQAEAITIGARIYAERPGAYGKRIGGYVKVARSSHETAIAVTS